MNFRFLLVLLRVSLRRYKVGDPRIESVSHTDTDIIYNSIRGSATGASVQQQSEFQKKSSIEAKSLKDVVTMLRNSNSHESAENKPSVSYSWMYVHVLARDGATAVTSKSHILLQP